MVEGMSVVVFGNLPRSDTVYLYSVQEAEGFGDTNIMTLLLCSVGTTVMVMTYI